MAHTGTVQVHYGSARARALVRFGRPWFWPLGWAGCYLGIVLGTGGWLPSPADVPAFVVLGPLVWGAVLAVNDLHDLPGDRRNPRKATAPLVTGELTEIDLRRVCRWCAVCAVAVSATVGPAFVAGTVAVLVLGWLYSAPPVRLKSRPGADVFVNALAVGVLGPLAGWSLHRPAAEFPPVMVLLGLLLGAALYLPTTVIDRDADALAGYATSAVRWSPLACYRAGVALWLAANAVWLVVCHLDVLADRESWALQTAVAPAVVAVYAVAIRRPTIFRMALVCVAFAVPATDFLRAVATSR